MAMLTWCGKPWTGCLGVGDTQSALAAPVHRPLQTVQQHPIMRPCAGPHNLQVSELQEMWPDLSEAAATRALELCNGK